MVAFTATCRVSLTDRGNLRDTYCMPNDFADWLPGPELLTLDELMPVLRLATDLGRHCCVARS